MPRGKLCQTAVVVETCDELCADGREFAYADPQTSTQRSSLTGIGTGVCGAGSVCKTGSGLGTGTGRGIGSGNGIGSGCGIGTGRGIGMGRGAGSGGGAGVDAFNSHPLFKVTKNIVVIEIGVVIAFIEFRSHLELPDFVVKPLCFFFEGKHSFLVLNLFKFSFELKLALKAKTLFLLCPTDTRGCRSDR